MEGNLSVDLAILKSKREEFERESAIVIQKANEAIAANISKIQDLLQEISNIAEAANIGDLDFDDVYNTVDSMRDEFNGSWNSSNC
jgi:hypothetical protein